VGSFSGNRRRQYMPVEAMAGARGRGGGGHGTKHAAAAHVRGGHGHAHARAVRGHVNRGTHALVFATARYAARAYNWNHGARWEVVVTGEIVIGIPTMIFPFGYYGLGYGYPYYRLTLPILIIPTDTILISMDTGPTRA
jgi:hypothetical protein